MPINLGEAVVNARLDTKRLDRDLKTAKHKIHTSVKEMQRELNSLKARVAGAGGTAGGGLLGGLGVASLASRFGGPAAIGYSIYKTFKIGIPAAMELEKQIQGLNTVLKATGGTCGYTTDELVKMAGALEQTSRFGDDTIITAEKILATFKSIHREAFKPALEAAMDLSVAFDKDLKSSIIMVGKALDDPKRGLASLRMVGVSFTEKQQELIKSLVDSNRLLEAQRMIIQALREQVGGMARNEMETLSGQWSRFGNNLSDTARAIVHIKTGFSGFAEILKGVNDVLVKINAGLEWWAKFQEKHPWFATMWNYGPLGMGLKAIGSMGKKKPKYSIGEVNLEDQLAETAFELPNLPINEVTDYWKKRFLPMKDVAREAATVPKGPNRVDVVFERAVEELIRLKREAESKAQYYLQMAYPFDFGVKPQLAEVTKLYKQHYITNEQRLAIEKTILERFASAGDETVREFKNDTDEMTEFARQAARNMQDAFSDFFFDAMRGEFDSLVDDFAAMLERMMAELVASKILNILFGKDFMAGGDKIGGLLGKLGSKLFGGGSSGALSGNLSGMAYYPDEEMASGGWIDEPVRGVGLKTGTKYLIGEAGPELVVPANKIQKGGSGGVQVIINNKGTEKKGRAHVTQDLRGLVINVMLEDAISNGPYIRTLRGGM